MRSLGCVVVLALLTGCPPARLDVECLSDSDCNLGGAGFCTLADTGRKWCAYPDESCPPTGLRYSDYDVEDEVSGDCVPDTPTLTVQLGGKGTGGVFSNPAGLTCSGETCTGRFPAGTLVQLSAETTTGSFLGWIDGCLGRETCAVTMDGDRTVGALFGTSGEALWARQFGYPQSASPSDIAKDLDGNLIIVGTFNGTISSGIGAGLSSIGGSDIYVIKLAASTGEVVWAKRFGTGNELATSVGIDSSGDIYVGGSFSGTTDLGGGPIQAQGSNAIFALKLRGADGSFGWARKVVNSTGTGALDLRAVAVRDGLVFAGRYSGSIAADTMTSTSAGEEDFYVLKMSAETGAMVWVRFFGGNANDWVNDVTIDGSGNVILTGAFTGTVNYGGGSMPSGLGFTFHVFLLKLTASGAHVLSRHFGPEIAFLSAGEAVTVDAANNIFVTGTFHSNSSDQIDIDLGCGNIVHAGPFIAKYLASGTCVWAHGLGGTGSGIDVDMSINGELAVMGNFSGSISIGGRTFTSASASTDVFATRLTDDGTYLSSLRAGGTGPEQGAGAVQSVDGRIFITGTFQGATDLAGEKLTPAGTSDMFIVAHAPY